MLCEGWYTYMLLIINKLWELTGLHQVTALPAPTWNSSLWGILGCQHLCVRVFLSFYVFLNWSPQAWIQPCAPVWYVPYSLFFSSSRGCFVICEHPEASWAVGVLNSPTKQAPLVQLSDILSRLPSPKMPFAFPPSHSHLGVFPLPCLHWCHPLWRRWLRMCPPQWLPVFCLGPDEGHLLCKPSATIKIPSGLISEELWHNSSCYHITGHIFIFNFLSCLSREPSMDARQKLHPIWKSSWKYLRPYNRKAFMSGIPSLPTSTEKMIEGENDRYCTMQIP